MKLALESQTIKINFSNYIVNDSLRVTYLLSANNF